MVFIMRAYAKCKTFSIFCILVLVGVVPFSARPVHAQNPGVEIKNAVINKQGDSCLLSADIVYTLSPKAKHALQKGIPLNWEVAVKVAQRRSWLWDKKLLTFSMRYRIQYQALFNSYRVTQIDNNESESFSNLQAALADMGMIKDWVLVKQSAMERGSDYYVGIKVNFDREALPLPLRPEAYVNPQWYLSSAWALWPLEN